MITPPDPFAQSFDSIEIEHAPSPAAIENALLTVCAAAPDDGRPGFFLLDDADGRFVVDRDMGVVMLRDETLLARERGAVYAVRLRVVEPSGASYDLDLKLRITGQVPQVLGAEDFGFTATPAPEVESPAPRGPGVAWTAFAAVRGLQTAPALAAHGAFGAIFVPTWPVTNQHVTITFADRIPAPAPAHAAWSH